MAAMPAKNDARAANHADDSTPSAGVFRLHAGDGRSAFRPLPDDWLVGSADIVQSTKAIAENRYKAVNMAGAAVIVAITNALQGRDFPFVFGGDGASFAVSAADADKARQALAETATWVTEDLDLTLRVGMVPVADIRAQGHEVRVARFAPSPSVAIAMFSGGGLAFADAAMKRGEIAVAPAPPGAHPDLSGLSCRYELIPSQRGQVLSLVVMPGPANHARRFPRRRSQPSPPSSSRRRMRRGHLPVGASSSNGRLRASISKRARRARPANRSACANSRYSLYVARISDHAVRRAARPLQSHKNTSAS